MDVLLETLGGKFLGMANFILTFVALGCLLVVGWTWLRSEVLRLWKRLAWLKALLKAWRGKIITAYLSVLGTLFTLNAFGQIDLAWIWGLVGVSWLLTVASFIGWTAIRLSAPPTKLPADPAIEARAQLEERLEAARAEDARKAKEAEDAKRARRGRKKDEAEPPVVPEPSADSKPAADVESVPAATAS